MSALVDVQTAGSTWTLTLNRPDKLNAFNGALVDELQQALDAAHAAQARLLVLKGEGKSFSAGFDLSDLASQSEGDLVLRFIRIELLLQTVSQSPARTLALAHGKVFGAGCDLFAACQQRIASPETVFRMPGLKFGLVLGSRRFADLVGVDTARQILEDASPFDVARAQSIGFVHQACAADQWPQEIDAAQRKSEALDDWTRAALYRAIGNPQSDVDLSSLVRSAARPGLKERLLAYVKR